MGPNDLHYLTFRGEPMADPMDTHALPRHPTRSPVRAHGIPRGRPWASMVEHVVFRGRPSKVPWDPMGITVQLDMVSHVGYHGMPRELPWAATWNATWDATGKPMAAHAAGKKQENCTQGGVRGSKGSRLCYMKFFCCW